MRATRWIILLLPLLLLFTACEKETPLEPVSGPASGELAPAPLDPELAAAEVMRAAGFAFDPAVDVPERVKGTGKSYQYVFGAEREDLGNGIAHYTFPLRVGWGEHDLVHLHRVVKETRPGRPIRTRKNIFLQHGDAVGFVKFLFGPAAPSVPDHHAAAIHLAEGGVDVWGVDQNWVLVPLETADFGFMADWGMDNQIGNLRAALAVARFVRLFSGGGFGTMNLLGYSSGGATGYAYVNDEAARPACERHVGGLVCADMIYKFGPDLDHSRQFFCSTLPTMEERLAAGDYVDPIPFVLLGELAALDPDGASPIIPGFTNRQAALFFSAATFAGFPATDWFHYFGGHFDPESGMPYDLRFTSFEGATDFMRTGCSWEALRFIYDYTMIACDETDVPWDDHLSDVTVPILYLGPLGGMGMAGHYTLGLFGSTDIQTVDMGLLGPGQWVEDFGHIDMWTAPEAPEIVWQPLLEWINAHTPGDGRHHHVYD